MSGVILTALPRASALLLLIVAFCAGPGVAQSSSDEGAPFLLLPVGADAVGVGRAVTALPGQESVFWNPAGLASLEQSRFVLARGDVQVATSTAVSALFARRGVGALGISYLLLDAGDQEYRDRDDNLTGTISIRNHLAVVSTAARLLPGLDVGANFKLVQEHLSCRGMCLGFGSTSTTFAVDAGAQFQWSDDVPLRLGVLVAHLGPRFQLENASQADPLPTRIRIGMAYDLLRRLGTPGLEGWLSAEVQDRPGYQGGTSMHVGFQLAAGRTDALFVRAGYVSDADQPGGPSVGLGLRFEQFFLSFAKSLAVTGMGETEPLNVSFAIRL